LQGYPRKLVGRFLFHIGRFVRQANYLRHKRCSQLQARSAIGQLELQQASRNWLTQECKREKCHRVFHNKTPLGPYSLCRTRCPPSWLIARFLFAIAATFAGQHRSGLPCHSWSILRISSAQSNSIEPLGNSDSSSKKLDRTSSTASGSTHHFLQRN